jgi:hypothetical protein
MSIRTSLALAAAALLLPGGLLRADGPIPTDKEKKPPKKVITEEDLRAGRGSRGTVSVGTPDAQPSAEPAKEGEAAKTAPAAEEPSEADKRETRRKEMQAEIDHESANVTQLQRQIDTAQKELNDLSDYTYSMPGTNTGRRAALLKLIEDANAQIKTSNEKIEQLQDEARRAGIAVTRP